MNSAKVASAEVDVPPASSLQARPPQSAIAAAIKELHSVCPGQVYVDNANRQQHANTLTWITPQIPDVVVKPQTDHELFEIVDIARRNAVPIIPYGGGTSLEGHVNAPFGGISLDMSHFNKIIDVNVKDRTARVEAGVALSALNQRLAQLPVFFSVDPGAGNATLGGLAATRASGTNTVRYGTMRENVQSLEVVLSDGRIIETATSAPKSAAGYDLTHLFIGSEGTLGLISRLTVKLHARPDESIVAVIVMPSVQAACDTVIDALADGIEPARIELLDGLMVRAVNRHSQAQFAEVPTLFVELHGHGGATKSYSRRLQEIASKHGARRIEEATSLAERAGLWAARHDAFHALATMWPGKNVLVTDVCVPLSRLAEAIAKATNDIARLDLTAPIVGHVGDGNFHVLPVFDGTDKCQCAAVQQLVSALNETALQLGGTCTGEHGIGQGKAAALIREAGPGLDVMRAIKQALDPGNIFNPGKIFPH